MTLKRSLSFGCIALAMVLSSQSYAASMDCTVGFTYATNKGVVALSKKIDLKNAEIVKSSETENYSCAERAIYGLILQLCAAEVDAKASTVQATLKVMGGANSVISEDRESLGTNLLRVTENFSSILVPVQTKNVLSPVVAAEFEASGLKAPAYSGGDTQEINQVISEAVQRNVIDDGRIVTVNFSECRIK